MLLNNLLKSMKFISLVGNNNQQLAICISLINNLICNQFVFKKNILESNELKTIFLNKLEQKQKPGLVYFDMNDYNNKLYTIDKYNKLLKDPEVSEQFYLNIERNNEYNFNPSLDIYIFDFENYFGNDYKIFLNSDKFGHLFSNDYIFSDGYVILNSKDLFKNNILPFTITDTKTKLDIEKKDKYTIIKNQYNYDFYENKFNVDIEQNNLNNKQDKFYKENVLNYFIAYIIKQYLLKFKN